MAWRRELADSEKASQYGFCENGAAQAIVLTGGCERVMAKRRAAANMFLLASMVPRPNLIPVEI